MQKFFRLDANRHSYYTCNMKRQLSIRLNDEESSKIDSICEQYGVRAAYVLRAALAAYKPTAKSLEKVVRPVGLAGADEETRTRVGKMGAEATHGKRHEDSRE